MSRRGPRSATPIGGRTLGSSTAQAALTVATRVSAPGPQKHQPGGQGQVRPWPERLRLHDPGVKAVAVKLRTHGKHTDAIA